METRTSSLPLGGAEPGVIRLTVLHLKCVSTGMGLKSAVLPDLAGLRAMRGLSLDEIARSTNITMRYLEAIERGEFQKLPGGVYTRSYIRQYAEAAGCDVDLLLDHYRDTEPRRD